MRQSCLSEAACTSTLHRGVQLAYVPRGLTAFEEHRDAAEREFHWPPLDITRIKAAARRRHMQCQRAAGGPQGGGATVSEMLFGRTKQTANVRSHRSHFTTMHVSAACVPTLESLHTVT